MLKWLRRGQCWEIYRGKLAEFNDWFNVRKEKLRWLQHYGFGDQMEDEKREQRSRLVGRHAVLVVCGAVKWVCPAGSCILVVVFSHSVVSDSLWFHGLQHIRLPCPSSAPEACSNSCPLSWWCHPTISSSVIPFSTCLQSFPASVSSSNESVLPIRWWKYWNFIFSISPSSEYSGLISLRIDWLDLLVVQGTLKSLLQSNGSKASILQLLAFFVV